MNNRDVYVLFNSLVCPTCSEMVNIDMDNPAFPFTSFTSQNEPVKDGCKEFNLFLNNLLEQVKIGELSDEHLSQCLAQYRN